MVRANDIAGVADAKSGTSASAELEVLLVDYQALREDDRSIANSQGALASVFVALLAGLFAIVVGDCRFRGSGRDSARSAGSCYELVEPLYVVAPALPFAVITYIVMLGIQVTIKAFYMRAIENELRRYRRAELEALPGVLAASATEVLLAITSPSRGKRGYFVMLLFLTLSFAVALAGWVIFVSIHLSTMAAVFMLLLYGPILLLLLRWGIRANTGGRKLIRSAASALKGSGNYPVTDLLRHGAVRDSLRSYERHLVSYLIIPRPLDVVKWAFIPLAFIVGLLVSGRGWNFSGLSEVVLVWLVFEYLIYQARYQWNDVRGLHADLNHPGRKQRGRLPVAALGPVRSILMTIVVLMLRNLLALYLTLEVLSSHGRILIWCSFAGVWIPALVYEALRAGTKGPRFRAVAIWLVVGAGYAVRAAVGLVLAGMLSDGRITISFALFVSAAWAFGIVFVTSTWCLEAIGHCRIGNDETYLYTKSLKGKPQLFYLLSFVSIRLREIRKMHGGDRADSVAILASRTHLLAPWNVALIFATAAVTLACQANMVGVALAALSTSLAFVLVIVKSVRKCWLAALVSILMIGFAEGFLAGWMSAMAATVATAVFFLIYTSFRQSTYADIRDFLIRLKDVLRRLTSIIGRGASKVARWVVGSNTWRYVTSQDVHK